MKLARTLVVLLLLVSVLVSSLTVMGFADVHEKDSVFTYINEPPYGNWTFTRRPASPMKINASQIEIGANWTYVYTLLANHSYHIYCYGDWINIGSTPKTDYDIYVYNPLGELEGYHTEAAGLPEHLGTTIDQPFFTPKHSGNYSFVVRNDPRESQAADAATFVVIENVEPNVWHNHFIEGKQDDIAVENTSWAYEFTTDSEQIEIRIQVPDTLDMYETRLYLMANPENKKGEMLNNVPSAWEPGLYGQTSAAFGGYNLNSKGFRGNAYASCEFFGQDMLINFTAPYKGESLYHLVLIGEIGTGTVSFRVKTNFGDSELKLAPPILRVYPSNETIVTAVSNNSNIQEAFLSYSTDNWKTSTISEMLVSNRTCNGTLPGQEAGITMSYRVEAFDFLDNIMILNGSYTVKYPTHVNFTLHREAVPLGENITISGLVRPAIDSTNEHVKLTFTASNGSKIERYYNVLNGNFSASFKPPFLGSWTVQAKFAGDKTRHDVSTVEVPFIVVEPSFVSRYSIYIYAGVGIAVAAIIVLVMIRRRQ